MKRFLQKETEEAIRKLTPMDDLLFANIYDGNVDAMNELLRVCLGDGSISVEEVKTHAFEPNLGYLEPVFDAVATDGTGRVFDVEVQRARRGDLLERASFYASTIQAQMMARGKREYRLRPVYVIFITEGDYWHTGLERVDICAYMEQTRKRMDDGRHLVFINGEARGESAIARLMHDFRCAEAEDMYYTELRKSVERLKNTEEGMGRMGGSYEEIMNRGRAEGKNEGRAEGRIEGRMEVNRETAIKMKADSLPIEAIAKYTGLSTEEIARL